MPLFEFECRSCGNEFEVLLKSSKEDVGCPRCESKEVEKKISNFSSVKGRKKTTSCKMARDCGESCCSGCCGNG